MGVLLLHSLWIYLALFEQWKIGVDFWYLFSSYIFAEIMVFAVVLLMSIIIVDTYSDLSISLNQTKCSNISEIKKLRQRENKDKMKL